MLFLSFYYLNMFQIKEEFTFNSGNEYISFIEKHSISTFIGALIESENEKQSFSKAKAMFNESQKSRIEIEEKNAKSIFQNILRYKLSLPQQQVLISILSFIITNNCSFIAG